MEVNHKEKEEYKNFIRKLSETVLTENLKKEQGIVNEEEIFEIYEQLNSDFPQVTTERLKELSEYIEKQIQKAQFDYTNKFKVTKKLIEGLSFSISQNIPQNEEIEETEEETEINDGDFFEDDGKDNVEEKKTEEKKEDDKVDDIELRNGIISSLYLSLILLPLTRLINIKNDVQKPSIEIAKFLDHYHPFDHSPPSSPLIIDEGEENGEEQNEIENKIEIEDDDDFEYESMEISPQKHNEITPIEISPDTVDWSTKIIHLIEEIDYLHLSHGNAWNSFLFTSQLLSLIPSLLNPSFLSLSPQHLAVAEKYIYFSIQILCDRTNHDSSIIKPLIGLLHSHLNKSEDELRIYDQKLRSTIRQYQHTFSIQILSSLSNNSFCYLITKHYPHYLHIKKTLSNANSNFKVDFSVVLVLQAIIDSLPLIEDRLSYFINYLKKFKADQLCEIPVGSLIEFRSISIIIHFVCLVDHLKLHLNEENFVFQSLLQNAIISNLINLYLLIQSVYCNNISCNERIERIENDRINQTKDELEKLILFITITENQFAPFVTKVKKFIEVIQQPQTFPANSLPFKQILFHYLLNDNQKLIRKNFQWMNDKLKEHTFDLISLEFLHHVEELLNYFVIISQTSSANQILPLFQSLSNSFSVYVIPSHNESINAENGDDDGEDQEKDAEESKKHLLIKQKRKSLLNSRLLLKQILLASSASQPSKSISSKTD